MPRSSSPHDCPASLQSVGVDPPGSGLTCVTAALQVESVATTLSLAEQNHAEELKRVCLDYVSRNLQAVMTSEGYHHMVTSCPQLQARARAHPCRGI